MLAVKFRELLLETPGLYEELDQVIKRLKSFLLVAHNDDGTAIAGTLIVRTVDDAGPMTVTDGTIAEIVFNRANSKFYGCTVTGTPATWAALN